MIDLQPLVEAAARLQHEEFLDAHAEYTTLEVAAQARAAIEDALAAGRAPAAQVIAVAASALYSRAGDPEGMARSHFDFLQVEFMEATQAVEYGQVRAQVLELHDRARGAA